MLLWTLRHVLSRQWQAHPSTTLTTPTVGGAGGGIGSDHSGGIVDSCALALEVLAPDRPGPGHLHRGVCVLRLCVLPFVNFVMSCHFANSSNLPNHFQDIARAASAARCGILDSEIS